MRGEGSHYNVELKIRLLADTYLESALQGESIDLLVNEVWQVGLDDTAITIQNYRVEPAN